MQVLLTRESVALGDDVDAPHDHVIDLPAELPLRAAVASVVSAGYLPQITGGQATWVLVAEAGRSIAVVAQQWREPRLLTTGESALAALASADGTVRWHFRYLAQQHPEAIHGELHGIQA